ncbi:MAG: hypothetical protein ACYC55_09230 [Candidatus Geothermincolia bacterium]
MKRSHCLLVMLCVLALLASAAFYGACAGKLHRPIDQPVWASEDDSALTLLCSGIGIALAALVTALAAARMARSRFTAICPHCHAAIRTDERACADCGARFV